MPTSMQSNPNVKKAVIAFQRPQTRQLECGQYHTYKLRTTPTDATSPIYELSAVGGAQETKRQAGTPKLCSCQYLSQRQQINEHVFPKKAGQTQKHYMQRHLWLVGGMTIKEWVALVSELNGYLKDFPTHNGNKT
eukprot:7655313-Ditylum_brightwellii.AAC.1